MFVLLFEASATLSREIKLQAMPQTSKSYARFLLARLSNERRYIESRPLISNSTSDLTAVFSLAGSSRLHYLYGNMFGEATAIYTD